MIYQKKFKMDLILIIFPFVLYYFYFPFSEIYSIDIKSINFTIVKISLQMKFFFVWFEKLSGIKFDDFPIDHQMKSQRICKEIRRRGKDKMK